MLNNNTLPSRDRIFSPIVTTSAFISQVLSSDQSCRNAVSKVLEERLLAGEKTISTNTSAYCDARIRLSETGLRETAQIAGVQLHARTEKQWAWKGRSVKLVDGTTVSMPDTPENQKEFPQAKTQKKGAGFPIARLVAILSLSVGSILDVAIGPYKGKESGEPALLRTLLDTIIADDLLLGDRYYCSYFLLVSLMDKSADAVFQMHASRKYDFRKGRKIGPKDHLVAWDKPKRPEWMDKDTYEKMPNTITIRETHVGKKVIVSTLLKHDEYSKKDIEELYRKRWAVEVDLRCIKDVMQMDILRCKTPTMVRKEIYTHVLAYNLIRIVMAQSAILYDKHPRMISFKGTIQILNAFKDALLFASKKNQPDIFKEVLRAIATHCVGKRPGRKEPRAVKRRAKSYPLLKKSRRLLA